MRRHTNQGKKKDSRRVAAAGRRAASHASSKVGQYVLLTVFLLTITSPVPAQSLEIVTRYDYYFEEDTSATLLLHRGSWAEVATLVVDDEEARALDSYTDARAFRIDVGDYGLGEHRLRARAVLASGKIEELQLELRKLPAKPNAVRVDRLTGGLMVDDLPFFPFGFYAGYPVGDLPVQEIYNAMNLIGVYQSNEEETLVGRKAYMDLCASVGMKVNYAVNGLVGTPHNRTEAVISAEEEERRWALLRKEVETFKDHPALLSWYMNDEPVGQSRSPDLLEKAYRIIKEIDPYHPVSVVFVIPERAAPFMNALDIAMTDPYPIPGDVDAVRVHMGSLKKHFRYRKALWLVPQAFGGGEFWRREPTGAEIRVMTWIGIQEGAMGVQYFIRRAPNLFPKSRLAWNEAVRAAHEVSMILPWLFSDEPRSELPTGSDGLRATTLSADGSTLLLVVNASDSQARLELDLSPLIDEQLFRLDMPFENRTVDLPDGRLVESLDPLAVRAYLIDEAASHPDDVTRHNLFPNPSFEWVPSPGVPAGAYADSDRRPRYDGSTYFVDSRVSHVGRNALRFHSVSDTSHLALTFYRMYVQPDRLYHTSLWSRHPRYASPTRFKVSILGTDVENILETSATWTKKGLYFKTTEQTPYVQLRLETQGAGTFWVDDVVVLPDPFIDVVVRDGPVAEVRLGSTSPNVTLSYSLNGKEEQAYSEPFELSTFTDLNIHVRSPSRPAERISVTVPLSSATLKQCELETPYSEKYSASRDATLTDGEYGSLSFRDGKYLGFDGKDVTLTIDLEESTTVGFAEVHFLVSVDDGIHAPTALEAWTSSDGTAWTALGSVDTVEASRHGNPYQLGVRVEGLTREARFVKVTVSSPKVIPQGYLFSGTDAWLFLDEVLVDHVGQ